MSNMIVFVRGGRHWTAGGTRQRSCPGTKTNQPATGKASHVHFGFDHGRLHPVLVTFLLPVLAGAAVPVVQHTTVGVRLCFLAGLHKLGSESSHLHYFQQRFPSSFPAHDFPLQHRSLLNTKLTDS